MNTGHWNSWFQIAANLGLIGGLVLLGVQIQQTRNLTRLQMQLEGTLAFQEVEIAALGENPAEAWAKSIQDPESLSPAEVKIVDSWLIHQVNQWRRTAFMKAEGLAEPGATERHPARTHGSTSATRSPSGGGAS